MGALVGGAHRELVAVGLAQADRAGRGQAFDDRRVEGAHVVLEHPRAGGRTPSAGHEDVLVRDRDAEQRAALAAPETGVGLARLGERQLGLHVDEGVQLAAGDPVEEGPGQRDRGGFAGIERRAQLPEGSGVEVHGCGWRRREGAASIIR